jgi:hypothetical protein
VEDLETAKPAAKKKAAKKKVAAKAAGGGAYGAAHAAMTDAGSDVDMANNSEEGEASSVGGDDNVGGWELVPFHLRSNQYDVESTKKRFPVLTAKQLGAQKQVDGALFFNIKKKMWEVVRNDTTMRNLKHVLNFAIPNAGRGTTADYPLGAPNNAWKKWQAFRPVDECRYNHFPIYPSELTRFLCFTHFFVGANQALQGVQAELLVRTHDPSESMECPNHPKQQDGCGAFLGKGDLVVIDGRDCTYIGYGVYEVGVYDFTGLLSRGCRRGVTRCYYQHLAQIVHKVAIVGCRLYVASAQQQHVG